MTSVIVWRLAEEEIPDENKGVMFKLKNQKISDQKIYLGYYDLDENVGFVAKAEINSNGWLWSHEDKKYDMPCFKISEIESWAYLTEI